VALAVQYHARLCEYLNTFDKAFIVGADNVGSKQFQDIRAVSRGLLC
jgi:large subunit ribosomal protein LP0